MPQASWFIWVAGSKEPAEAERCEILCVDGRIRLEMALDVPGVDADQAGCHDPLEPDRIERQERGPDGERVGDREVTHVWARTVVSTGIDVRSGRPRATTMTATPVTNIASVDSMNGAPRMAPIPTPSAAALP